MWNRRTFLGSLLSSAVLAQGKAAFAGGVQQPPSVIDGMPMRFGVGVHHVEGVLVDRHGNVYGGNHDGLLYKIAPTGELISTTNLPRGSQINGMTMDREGRIIYCDLGRRGVFRISESGETSLIADRAGDVPFTLPNYLCYDAEGNLYVSITATNRDISTILLGFDKPEPTGVLLRIRPNGRTDIVSTGLYMPNGIAIDPWEEAIYVLQSSTRDCVRIPMRKDGSFGKPEIFARGFPGLPDGITFDSVGQSYVTIPGVVINGQLKPTNELVLLSKDGEWTSLISDPIGKNLAAPTNCAFGGRDFKDLFIANLRGAHLTHVRLTVKGHPLYHLR